MKWANKVAPRDAVVTEQSPATKCVGLLRLLHAVDCFPRGGLYNGYYAVTAAVRYERFWPEIMKCTSSNPVPPLDVAFAWFAHRQDPLTYQKDLRRRGLDSASVHAPTSRAFGFGPRKSDLVLWKSAAGAHPAWPPPAPGTAHGRIAGISLSFAYRVANTMNRLARMLHSWLRPQFLDASFLNIAQDRYIRFLELHAAHPSVTLVPTADIALVWHTHLGMSGDYADACGKLFGGLSQPWAPDYLNLRDSVALTQAYVRTAKLYQTKYGEPYDSLDTAWLAESMPYPLVTSSNPLAFALRVFDDNPDQEKQRPHVEMVGMQAAHVGITNNPVPRAGGHALYAAWLAAKRAAELYDRPGFSRCCFIRRRDIQKDVLREVVSSLVSISYFLELPDIDTHPYLSAIVLRPGRWMPQPPDVSRAPTVSVVVLFAPSDPAAYLDSCLMDGLTDLLTSSLAAAAVLGAQEHTTRGSPLWPILARMRTSGTELGSLADAYYADAWAVSNERGVGSMQRSFQHAPRKHDGCQVVEGQCDYYRHNQLYMKGVAPSALGA